MAITKEADIVVESQFYDTSYDDDGGFYAKEKKTDDDDDDDDDDEDDFIIEIDDDDEGEDVNGSLQEMLSVLEDEIGESETGEEESDDSDEPEEDLIVLDLPNEKEEFTFSMPKIPGALDDSDIEERAEIEVAVNEAGEPEEIDDWDWGKKGGHAKFLNWLSEMIDNTPQHSGRDVSGLERAMAWLERLSKEIPKATRTDFKGELDINNCEAYRKYLGDTVGDIEKRIVLLMPKRGKKAHYNSEGEIVKNAQKAPNITGITVTVPLLISGIVRTLINGTVSAGHSMEDMFEELSKKYKLTDRELFEVQILLSDMNFPIKQDRGRIGESPVDMASSENFDWAANYKS